MPSEARVRPEDYSTCGLDCRQCDVYAATVHGDQAARLRAAKLFEPTAREHWGLATLDPLILDCRGCRSGCVQHQGYGRCPIPGCAQSRGLVSCGQCGEWTTCPKVGGVLADEPQARANLQAIADGAGAR